jgi:hypothetical protein
VVRRDWTFAKSGKPAAIFEKRGPRKKIVTEDRRQRELTFDPQQTLVSLSDSLSRIIISAEHRLKLF